MLNNRSLELKKHVGTIHSLGRSLLQRKIANGLLYNAYDELLIKEEHQISIKDLCKLIGYYSHDIKSIKKALVDLLSTVVEWNLVDKNSFDKDGTWNASSIIADASIDGPICSYSYSNKMKKLLYHPSVYGRLNMVIQARFKSSYGLALYENCIRYQNLSNTPWFDFLIFRKLMGVGDNKYVVFSEFKKRVLNIAIKEINLYSPIIVNPEVQKIRKGVVSIRFLITRKIYAENSNICDESSSEEIGDDSKQLIYSKLQDNFGISNNQISKIMSQYEEQYIVSKINLIHSSSSFLNGKIKNLAKYLLDALEKDYQPPKSSKEIIVKKDMESFVEKEKKELQERFTRKHDKYVRLKIMDNFNVLKKDQRDELLKRFLNAGNIDTEIVSLYHKRGLLNGYVNSKFISFVKEQKIELLNDVLSFENYCEQSCEKIA